MRRSHAHLGLLILLVASWGLLARIAAPAPYALDARWVPERCHHAPGFTGRLAVTGEALRRAGVPAGWLPLGARGGGEAEVTAARAGDRTYLVWATSMDRIVVARAELDRSGALRRVPHRATVHAREVIDVAAHDRGLSVWTSGDHGVRRVSLARDLSVREFDRSGRVEELGPTAHRVDVPFRSRSLAVEEDTSGRRSLVSPADPLRGVSAARLPLGRERLTCVRAGDEVALLGRALGPFDGALAWRVRYGSPRLAGLGVAGALVIALLLAMAAFERRLRGLEGPIRVGELALQEGRLTWFDDEQGAAALRSVGARIGEGRGRAVLVGAAKGPRGSSYREAGTMAADAVFVGSPLGWRRWLARRQRAVFAGWIAAAAVSALGWALLATARF